MPQLDYNAMFSTALSIFVIFCFFYSLMIMYALPAWFNIIFIKNLLITSINDNFLISNSINEQVHDFVEDFLNINYE